MKHMRSVRVYRYRWVMLISLINLVLAGSLQWLNFAPVGRVVNAYYHDQIYLRFFNPVDLLSLTYLIVYVLFSVPSGWIIRKLGMRVTYWIASGLIIFGAMTKTLYLSSFKTVLFGHSPRSRPDIHAYQHHRDDGSLVSDPRAGDGGGNHPGESVSLSGARHDPFPLFSRPLPKGD